MTHPRFRNTFLNIGSLLVIVLYVLIDPATGVLKDLPVGASTIVLLASLLKALWYLSILHWGRKAILDYLDLKQLYAKAEQSPEGAGMAIIGTGLIYVGIAVCIGAAAMSN